LSPGRYHDDFWEVSDHDAHTWVEVWFRGYGWLPFDPTPGRGHLSGTYSSTSTGFNAAGAAKLLAGLVKGGEVFGSGNPIGIIAHDTRLRNPRSVGDRPFVTGGPVTPEPKKAAPSLLFFLFLLAAGVAAVIVLLKLGRRKVRYLTRDPRRVAVACARELAEFLRDQRVPAAEAAPLPRARRHRPRAARRRCEQLCASGDRSPVRPTGGSAGSGGVRSQGVA